MPVSTKYRFQVVAPAKRRNECLFLAEREGCATIGEWFRLLIKRELDRFFPESGEIPEGFDDWLHVYTNCMHENFAGDDSSAKTEG